MNEIFFRFLRYASFMCLPLRHDNIISFYDKCFVKGVYNPTGSDLKDLQDLTYCVKVKKTDGEKNVTSETIVRSVKGELNSVVNELASVFYYKTSYKLAFTKYYPIIEDQDHKIPGFIAGVRSSKQTVLGDKIKICIVVFLTPKANNKEHAAEEQVDNECPLRNNSNQLNLNVSTTFKMENLKQILSSTESTNSFDITLKNYLYAQVENDTLCKRCSTVIEKETLNNFILSLLFVLEFDQSSEDLDILATEAISHESQPYVPIRAS